MSEPKPETDEQRLARMDKTGLIKDSKDLLLRVKAAKPLTDEEVKLLIKSVQD